MAHARFIKLLAPLMVLTSWTSQAARAVTVTPGAPDRSALTGQLMQWTAKGAVRPADAAVAAGNHDSSAAADIKGQVMGVDDLIASGPITAESLLEKTPPPALPRPKASHLPAAAEVAAATYAGPKLSGDSSTHAVLTITATAEGLVFSPEAITLPTAEDKITIRLAASAEEGLQLFVRNQKVAELNAAATELAARKVGTTELYAVAKGRMYIIPVRVSEPSPNGPTLSVPAALLSLNGVIKDTSLASATYPGLQQATASTTEASLDTLSDDPVAMPPPSQPRGDGYDTASAPGRLTAMNDTPIVANPSAKTVNPAAPSLKTSIAETAQSLIKQAAEGRRFYNAKEKIGYTTAQIQLIDDRSVPSTGVIYPVANVTVRVLGTEFMAKTDATGHLTIRDMPRKARFMLRIDDPSGQYRGAIAELSTADLAGGVTRLRVMRTFAFDALTQIAASVQQSSRGSYCASVTDKNAEGGLSPAADIAVQLDTVAEGPFYFNNFGFLDRTMNGTGPNGRFCFFNAAPGPMALSLFRAGAPLATLPVSAFAGRHVEDDFNLTAEAGFATQFASMATAQEQLSSDPGVATRYQQVDMIDLLPLGTDAPLPQVAPGRVALTDPLLSHQGRVRAFARAAEFEPTVYTYQAGDEQAVTPLIPRGFIEDMSLNAQVVHDPELGTVLAEYAAPEGATQETISMRLVDQEGHDVGDGWYFSDAPATKALFFNVPAGTYSLQVQTKDGYWLNSDTVIVYSETMSYMRLGNLLRYHP